MANCKVTDSKCVVLLAAYNGSKWLGSQLDSVLAQANVKIQVVVSDDNSTDTTLGVLNSYSEDGRVLLLDSKEYRFGSAGRNFARLIVEVDIGDAEFIALSDQDDLWFNDKISRAINVLRETGSSCYSSNVIAFWADGRKKVLNKSQKQTEIDYMFSAPGPGCTFVLRRLVFLDLKMWYIRNEFEIAKIVSHDWLIYAFARSKGIGWVIDPVPFMYYRQHESNELGANVGLFNMLRRVKKLLNGEYIDQVEKIGGLVAKEHPVLKKIKRFGLFDRVCLMGYSGKIRRSRLEAVFLVLVFLISHKKRSNLSE